MFHPRLVFLIVVVFAVVSCGGQASSQLKRLADHQHRLDTLWPGYSPSERAFGSYRGDGDDVLLLWRGEAPDGFSATDDARLWQGADGTFNLSGAFHIDADLNGLSATLLRDLDADSDLATLLHEDFHGYQGEAFALPSGKTLTIPDIGEMDPQDLFAALTLESALLLDVIQTLPTVDSNALATYIALRQWRENQLPESSVEAERQVETYEGTALWLDSHALALIKGNGAGAARDNIVRYIRDWRRGSSAATALVVLRVYGTGASLAEVLAQTDPHDWQQALEHRPISLFELLLERYHWPEEELTALAEQVLESDAFERHHQAAVGFGDPAQDNEQTVREVEQGHRWVLSITPDGAETSFAQLDGTFQISRFAYLPDGRLLLVDPAEYLGDLPSFHLSVRGNAMAIPMDDTENAISVYLKRAPSLLGEGIMDAGPRVLNSGYIRGSGLDIRFDMPLKITLERLD